MKAIFKKAYHFTQDRIVDEQTIEGSTKTRMIDAEIRVRPGLQPQEAPDWIKDTTLFTDGVSSRLIVEV
jgi:hypothetical protein